MHPIPAAPLNGRLERILVIMATFEISLPVSFLSSHVLYFSHMLLDSIRHIHSVDSMCKEYLDHFDLPGFYSINFSHVPCGYLIGHPCFLESAKKQ